MNIHCRTTPIKRAPTQCNIYDEGKNAVIALFGVAKCKQPSVIFVENIDCILSACESEGRDDKFMRTRNRFMKEKQLVEWEGGQILVIGSSTRPELLSQEVLNVFRNRLYLPLPSFKARWSIIEGFLERE
ncbi:ATPase family AAA domain-containing protein FIGL1-like [Rosa chinensis]|uniref:ATPase family AAA domain-containing protein FIGL1-like n=1 Tax=Rosa chinensis TaxID=74649 RepID=UPI001AD94050|nr:ATPase family AAA domain-containing protein FIGL1-like [Rosa chinensis]